MKRAYGFTLIETVFSIALFGVLMAVMFTTIKEFQRGWLKEYAKQATSKQFVKVYNAINSDLSGSSGVLVDSYKDSGAQHKGSRWFMFPVSEEVTETNPVSPANNTIGVNRVDGYPIYTKVIVYNLETPEKCCKKDGSADLPNRFCPHKRLIRRKILINSYTLPRSGEENIKKLVINKLTTQIAKILSTKTLGYLDSNFYVCDIDTIEHDIMDLTILKPEIDEDFEVRFNLKVLRIADAQKGFSQSVGGRLGERQLISLTSDGLSQIEKTAERYMEETAWTTITQNN